MSETPIEPDDTGFEQSENLDQMQPEDTLVDRGVADVLDEGYSPAENWGPGEGFGSTAEEAVQGENLDERLRQEEPDADPYADEDAQAPVDSEVGDARSGRLVDPGGGSGEDVEDRSHRQRRGHRRSGRERRGGGRARRAGRGRRGVMVTGPGA